LVLTSLPFFWRERNVPALSLISWIFVMNVVYAINSVVWLRSVIVYTPVWCDNTTKVTKLQSGTIPAILVADFCIARQFESIASGRIKHWTSYNHRRQRVFELGACVAGACAIYDSPCRRSAPSI